MSSRSRARARRSLGQLLRQPQREIAQLEWDFSGCPADELSECRAYEYARATAAVRHNVEALRSGLRNEFEELMSAMRRRLKYIDKTEGQPGPVDNVFWYCPEFPDKPYLSIAALERRCRIDALWPPATSAVTLHPVIVPHDVDRRLRRGRVMIGPDELALFRINWSESDTYLVDAFTNWLKENRSSRVALFDTRGAGNFARKWGDDLKALGAKRLLDQLPWADAFALTADVLRCVRGKGSQKRQFGLYADREEVWRRAKRRAQRIISAWERTYTSNRFD